jgi:hypothetical protein
VTVKVVTNNHRREILDGWSLTATERAEFDYIAWGKVDEGEESAEFVRFHGSLYDLGEFTASWGLSRDGGLPEHLKGWHGYLSESAFSAVVVRYLSGDDEGFVVMGRVLS